MWPIIKLGFMAFLKEMSEIYQLNCTLSKILIHAIAGRRLVPSVIPLHARFSLVFMILKLNFQTSN